ncbi:hypothetical protein [Flavobacterium hydrophilum]|uniref:Cytochrome C551 n=1 Tax=Flavobacterium hydrophilum TaxID=2211445 RepID=A0A2V4C3U4_9FLAO|nr:hypothetical protein [Flavobacterium hydrophilum]PXY45979.1 hypothetical protein DMB68_01980 [Flavobacterium hydrophilum]
MKTKLHYILFAVLISLTFSCTNDEDQEVTTISKAKTEKVELNKSVQTLQTPEDGEPSNPKTK